MACRRTSETDTDAIVDFICYQRPCRDIGLKINEQIIRYLINNSNQQRILSKFFTDITSQLFDYNCKDMEKILTNLDSAIKHEIKNIGILKDTLSKEHESVLKNLIFLNKIVKERRHIIGYKNTIFAYEYVKRLSDDNLKTKYNTNISKIIDVITQFESSIIILNIILEKIVPNIEIINLTPEIMNLNNNYKIPNDINYHKFILEGIIAILNDLINNAKLNDLNKYQENINILIESFNYMINIQNRIGAFLYDMIHNLRTCDTYDTYSELNIFTEETLKVKVKTHVIYILIMNEILWDNLVCLEKKFFLNS